MQAQAEADDVQPAANVPRRLQQKITKRVRFLEKVAASRAAPRLEAKGGTKKRQRRPAISERLKNFSSLAQSLEEAAKEARGHTGKLVQCACNCWRGHTSACKASAVCMQLERPHIRMQVLAKLERMSCIYRMRAELLLVPSTAEWAWVCTEQRSESALWSRRQRGCSR